MDKIIVFILSIILLVSCNENTKTEEGFLPIKGSNIHYKITGEGEPILLLHGGFLNLDAWDYQITELTDNNYKVIRYSELGHGKTENGKEKLEGVAVIDEFIKKKCNNEPISIVGLSWGGVLATDYTLKYPEKVKKLVLVSPGINGWDWFKKEETREKYKKLQAAYMANDSLKVGALSFDYWIIGAKREASEIDKVVREKLKKMIDDNISLNWGKSKSTLDTLSSIGRLGEIKKPTLIVSGEKDEVDILEIASIYEKGIKNSRREIISDVGHSLNVEKPKIFNKMILDFLTE